ncbi:MAG TPA: tripartite tricarboxylate transporter substrate binding protein [Clostridiaceae bacterium]|nr:tripartite tricarboxylate transporter substrate binding protein [Clostridiaceae bacterium]
MFKKATTLVLALSLILIVTGCASKPAEGPKVNFPEKPITLICPWAAGGGTDAVARAIAKAAESRLGQTVTVVNQTGGGGAVGHGAGIAAKNDGYTVTMITFELLSLPPQGLVPFTYEDYDLLMMVNMDPSALTVRADAPWKSVDEFIAAAKEKPGDIKVGNSGPGAVWHIAGGMLEQLTDIKLTHVPYDGAAPAVAALVGGHIDAVTVSPAEVAGQVQAGNLKILGVMADNSIDQFPDVPTFKEKGIDVSFGTWRGLAVPKDTPKEVKEILMNAFKEAYEDQEFQSFAKKAGLGLNYMSADEFKEFLDEQSKGVEDVMKALGMTKK